MQVVFHVEPFVANLDKYRLERACHMARLLERTARWQARIVVGANVLPAARDHAAALGFAPDLRGVGTGFLTETLGLDLPQMLVRQAEGARDDAAVLWLAEELRRSLGGEPPDVVLTWTPTVAYRLAFGRLPTVHLDAGAFSRPPFTFARRWYLDPVGPACLDLLGAAPAAPEALAFEAPVAAALDDVRTAVREHVERHSPYAGLVAELRGRFRKLVVLPLHYWTGPVFRRHTSITSHAELAWTVAAALPADVGVVAIQHPLLAGGEGLPEDLGGGVLPNLVVLPRLHWTAGATEYLTPLVDGLVTVDSKAAFGALLQDQPVLALGRGAFPGFAAGREELAGAAFLDRPPGARGDATAQRRLLAWMLTHYDVPLPVLEDGDWLPEYLARLVAAKGEARRALPKPWGPPAEVLRATAEEVRRHPAPLAVGDRLDGRPALAAALPAAAVPLALPLRTAGRVQEAKLAGRPATPLLLLEGGSAEFPPVTALRGFEAHIRLEQATGEWTPLFWAGDPARPWQSGRALCLFHHAPGNALMAVAGGPRAPQVSGFSRPGSMPLGGRRHCRVVLAEDRLLLLIDDVLEVVEPLPAGPTWAVERVLLGQDGHFPGQGVTALFQDAALLRLA